MPTDLVAIRRALISVSDKSGLVDKARQLADAGVDIISTGGTLRALHDAGFSARDAAEMTGFPEMMDGRVKTLHPAIHGGLLARRDLDTHVEAMKAHDIEPIDLLYVNLYPFENAVQSGADLPGCIEQIDIGGPAMIRSAAKNHDSVCVCVDPDDLDAVLQAMADNGGQTPLSLRRQLAAKAFARTAAYDTLIAQRLNSEVETPSRAYFSQGGSLSQSLRYGENPHQKAALYKTGEIRAGVASAQQVQGKELSYNNIADADAAFELVCEFGAETPAAVIVKHANPCGVALGDTICDAYDRALASDPVSAFGGIVALNTRLDSQTADRITKIFTEVVVAPDADASALEILSGKKNLRVLLTGGLADPNQIAPMVKTVAGGLLVQDRDTGRLHAADLKTVTHRAPTPAELDDLMFAWTLVKHVKSNAIVYAKSKASVGIGMGQTSRVEAANLAARKAADIAREAGHDSSPLVGSVCASDAFFPFADGLQIAIDAGATAVIQPGGSVRDEEVIAAADEAGIAMVFTGMRHFRH